jgi:hypothetical protein
MRGDAPRAGARKVQRLSADSTFPGFTVLEHEVRERLRQEYEAKGFTGQVWNEHPAYDGKPACIAKNGDKTIAIFILNADRRKKPEPAVLAQNMREAALNGVEVAVIDCEKDAREKFVSVPDLDAKVEYQRVKTKQQTTPKQTAEALERAEALRELFTEQAGLSHRAAAKALNDLGIKTAAGLLWTAVQVTRARQRLVPRKRKPVRLFASGVVHPAGHVPEIVCGIPEEEPESARPGYRSQAQRDQLLAEQAAGRAAVAAEAERERARGGRLVAEPACHADADPEASVRGIIRGVLVNLKKEELKAKRPKAKRNLYVPTWGEPAPREKEKLGADEKHQGPLTALSEEKFEQLAAQLAANLEGPIQYAAGFVNAEGVSGRALGAEILLSGAAYALGRATLPVKRWREGEDYQSFFYKFVRELGDAFDIPLPANLHFEARRTMGHQLGEMSELMKRAQDAVLAAHARQHFDALAVRLKPPPLAAWQQRLGGLVIRLEAAAPKAPTQPPPP